MKNVSQVVTYYAWDTSANAYKTGDSANHTLRGMQDTTEFTPAASPSEVDSTNLKGAYKVSIAATENIGNLMLLGGVSSTANIVLFPARWSNDPIPGVIRSGVAAGGAAGSITLDANADATTDDIYKGLQVAILSGTGKGQGARIITAYNHTTQVATVTPNWAVNPDNTSVFVLIPAGVDVKAWLGAAAPAMTGDAFARLGAPAGASVSADVAAVKSDTAAVKTQTDKLAFTVANQIDANVIDWKSATAPAMTGDAFARLGAPAGASTAADIAAVKTDSAAIKAKTDNLPPSPAATGAQMDVVNAPNTTALAAIADKILLRNIKGGSSTGRTVYQALAGLRNKADITAGVLTIYDEDDVTPLYEANVTTAAGNPLSSIAPTT